MKDQRDQDGQESSVLRSGLLALMFMAIISVTLLAQEQPAGKFKVDSYIPKKFVDLQWLISGSLSGDGSSSDDRSRNQSSIEISKSESHNDSQQVSLASSTSYRYETIPSAWGLGLGVGVDYSHGKNRWSSTYNNPPYDGHSESRNRSRNYVLSATPRINGDVYLRNDAFVSFSGSSYLQYSDASFQRDMTSDQGANVSHYTDRRAKIQRNYYVSLAAQPGWGRTYEGMYAATAIFIVGELRDNGLLQKEPTFSEMQQLTEIIYQFRLKHAIDYRTHKIEATQAIADYLISAGIIGEGQPKRFFLIEDIWRYMPTVARGFGFRTRVGIGTDYQYNGSQESYGPLQPTYQHSVTSDNHPYITANTEFHKPLDLRWQLDCNLRLRSYFNGRATEVSEGSQQGSGTRDERRYRNNYNLQGNVTISYGTVAKVRIRL